MMLISVSFPTLLSQMILIAFLQLFLQYSVFNVPFPTLQLPMILIAFLQLFLQYSVLNVYYDIIVTSLLEA